MGKNLNLSANEIKSIQVALISKEQHHAKLTAQYNAENDKEMGKIHWEQSCYYSDLNNKISEQLKK